jgi:hypothetical protein
LSCAPHLPTEIQDNLTLVRGGFGAKRPRGKKTQTD